MSSRFAWERAVKASDLPSTRKFVLLTLATHTNKGGKAWPSQARLAAECGVTERTIRSHLAAAMKDGWIERTRMGHKVGRAPESAQTSEYVIRIPNRNEASGCNESASGSEVPVGDLQPEPDDLQPETGRFAAGSGLPPITKDQSSNQISPADLGSYSGSSGGPFDESPKKKQKTTEKPPYRARVAAYQIGCRFAGVAQDEAQLRDCFDADGLLRAHPDLWDETLKVWRNRTKELQERSA